MPRQGRHTAVVNARGARMPCLMLCLAILLPGLLGCTPSTQEAGTGTTVEQTIVLASGRELGPANPHDYSSNMALLDLLYEPLVRYGSDGTIQPALATAWTISPDGRTWTFTLRPHVTFHDGTPFDAAAVQWNFDRWIGRPEHAWLPSASRIATVAAPDAATVVLTLRTAYYPTIQDLTLIRPVRFLSPKAVDPQGAFARPLGTGPWKMASMGTQRAVLVRNEDYWGDKPTLTKVVLDVILDAQTRVAALQSGEVQMIGGEYLGTIPPESLLTLRSDPALTVRTGSGVTSLHLLTPYNRPPFDDVRVRRALNLAIDRPGLVQAIFGGRAEAATGVMASAIPYVTRTATELYTFHSQRAAQLLAEAGWTPGANGVLVKDGQPLQCDLVVDKAMMPETASIAEAVQAQVKAIGIDLTVRLTDYSGWLQAYHAREGRLLMHFTWGPPYDPHTFVYGSFHTSLDPQTVPAYADATLDGLIDTVLASTDEQVRQTLYQRIWQHLDDHAAVVPLLSPQRLYAHRHTVTGFRLGGTEYDLAYTLHQIVMHRTP